jgi:hypothetical protein
MKEYSNLLIKEIAPLINTDFMMLSQWDGIAYDKTQWTDDFLKYDYIGAPWPWRPTDSQVGNGGISLRSKKLLDALMDSEVQITDEHWAEDELFAVFKRPFLEQKYGVEFAPTELASKFSFELGQYPGATFGFHGPWNIIYHMSDADVEYIIPKMDFRGWNHYKWHHVLCAAIRTNRMDIYKFLLDRLNENSPELLDMLSGKIEYTIKSTDNTQLTVW